MVDRNALVLVINDELAEIFYFKLEFVQTLKHYISVKFITSAEKQVEGVAFDIGLNLC